MMPAINRLEILYRLPDPISNYADGMPILVRIAVAHYLLALLTAQWLV